jgi:hypothetical protein
MSINLRGSVGLLLAVLVASLMLLVGGGGVTSFLIVLVVGVLVALAATQFLGLPDSGGVLPVWVLGGLSLVVGIGLLAGVLPNLLLIGHGLGGMFLAAGVALLVGHFLEVPVNLVHLGLVLLVVSLVSGALAGTLSVSLGVGVIASLVFIVLWFVQRLGGVAPATG